MTGHRHPTPSLRADRPAGRRGRTRATRERHAGRPRYTLGTRALALGALLAAGALTYTLIDTSQPPRTTARAAAPPAGGVTVTRTVTRTVATTAPASAPTPAPVAAVPPPPPLATPCVPAGSGCRYTLPRVLSAIVPASWRRQVSRHPGRVRLTLTGGPGELVDVDYTGQTIPRPSAIGRFHHSTLTAAAHGRVWRFRASFCAGRCTDYLLDVDGRGVAILARSTRPQTLAAAARIARTIEVAHG